MSFGLSIKFPRVIKKGRNGWRLPLSERKLLMQKRKMVNFKWDFSVTTKSTESTLASYVGVRLSINIRMCLELAIGLDHICCQELYLRLKGYGWVSDLGQTWGQSPTQWSPLTRTIDLCQRLNFNKSFNLGLKGYGWVSDLGQTWGVKVKGF